MTQYRLLNNTLHGTGLSACMFNVAQFTLKLNSYINATTYTEAQRGHGRTSLFYLVQRRFYLWLVATLFVNICTYFGIFNFIRQNTHIIQSHA